MAAAQQVRQAGLAVGNWPSWQREADVLELSGCKGSLLRMCGAHLAGSSGGRREGGQGKRHLPLPAWSAGLAPLVADKPQQQREAAEGRGSQGSAGVP